MKTMNTTRTGSHLRAALKHPVLALAFAAAAVLGSAQAAIPVGPSGSGPITFDTLPAPTEWATTITPIPGNGGTAVDLTGLDTLVNTLAATGITASMGEVTADPDGTTTQDGKWNSTALRLTSRAGTSAATCFMATLANTSGAAINEMDINFTLSGSAPAGEDPGMAGYALYYSLTGATSSWQRIGVYGTLGAVSVTNIPLSGPWADAANLYVLWVDDNGNGGGDGWYGFDDVNIAPSVPLTAPIGLTASAGDGKVDLAWTAFLGATGYNVKLWNGASYDTISTNQPGTTYTHSGLTNGTTYQYVVSAMTGVNESDNSAEVTATPVALPTPPGGVTELVLWLDANDSTTMTITGGTVNEWRDKLGSAAKMTRDNGAPTVVANGIGSIPTVHFTSGSSMGDGVNHAAPVTIFYVSRQTGGSNARVLSGGNNWLLGYWGGNRGSAYFDGDVLLGGNGESDTNPHLYATTIGGSGQNSTVWAEGSQIASNQGGTVGPDGLFLGGGGAYSEYSDCDISEVLVYNRVLNSTELDAVGGYLTAKYGLTTSYPTGLTVRLTSPANNDGFVSGTSVSATASVVSGTAPYTVKFFTRSLPGGTFAQAGGNVTTSPYTLDLGPLSDGSYEIYAEVTDSAGSPATDTSVTHTFTVAPATATTTAVVSSGSPSIYGDSVTFTATVLPVPTGGTVQFKNGGSSLGTPVAVNTTTGEATYTTTTLSVTTHEITADYSGYQIYEPSTTAASISQEVDKAGLTVVALNMLRLPNTANPEFVYSVTGFKNGQTLGTSGVTGTPALSTTAVLESPVGPYPITCAVGDLAASNYSFTSFVDAILTVADVADTFGVNFYADGSDPLSQIQPGIPAGSGDWFTPGWTNFFVPFGVAGPYVVPLTSNKGSSGTFTLNDARNGGTTVENPRTTNLGDGNYSLMAALAHGTSLESEPDYMKFDMEMSNIPFATYDVIFYFGSSWWNNDRTGKIVFNGAPERAFTLQAGAAYDGTFTNMVDGTTPGNYIVYTGVTGSSFTAVIYGDGFNHLGPTGFQIREAAVASGYGTWAAANAGGQTADQDYDNDGVENGIEYFMGQTGSTFTAMPGLDGDNTVTWPMDPAYAGTYEVQTSPDLVTWTNVDPKPMPSGGSLSYTLPTGAPGGKSFVRLLVTPTP